MRCNKTGSDVALGDRTPVNVSRSGERRPSARDPESPRGRRDQLTFRIASLIISILDESALLRDKNDGKNIGTR